ncbi:hypothetical protein [Pseudomonas viridiflava]|uniref:hypothetical protein n=1 Tax=Pseudomonas viridiflava TaxID=33069 RepID=UPI000F039F75|nr:hypothetical protein [Pseudomonas viridiflava]
MLKFTASALVIAATLGLAACDSKSEQKAQDAQAHQENAQQKMESAQTKVNDAAKENAEAAKDKAASKEAAAEESKTFVPTSEVTNTVQTPEKK